MKLTLWNKVVLVAIAYCVFIIGMFAFLTIYCSGLIDGK